MLLAEPVIVWLGVLLLVGFVGFFVVMLAMLVRFVRFLLRGLLGRRGSGACPPSVGKPRLCGNPRCGHSNSPKARYCARCGQALPVMAGLDCCGQVEQWSG